MPGSVFDGLHENALGDSQVQGEDAGYGADDSSELQQAEVERANAASTAAAFFRACKKCNRNDRIVKDCGVLEF